MSKDLPQEKSVCCGAEKAFLPDSNPDNFPLPKMEVICSKCSKPFIPKEEKKERHWCSKDCEKCHQLSSKGSVVQVSTILPKGDGTAIKVTPLNEPTEEGKKCECSTTPNGSKWCEHGFHISVSPSPIEWDYLGDIAIQICLMLDKTLPNKYSSSFLETLEVKIVEILKPKLAQFSSLQENHLKEELKERIEG